MYLWLILHTLYLHACQVRVTVGNSGLCCCTCVMYFEHQFCCCTCGRYFERQLTPLCVDASTRTPHCKAATFKSSLPVSTDLVLQSWFAAFTLIQSPAHVVQFCLQLETMGFGLQVLTAQPVVSWLGCHLVDCLSTQGRGLQAWGNVSSLQLVLHRGGDCKREAMFLPCSWCYNAN